MEQGAGPPVTRRLALFAADRVGLGAARALAEERIRTCALVLDGRDAAGLNSEIRVAAGALTDRLIEWLPGETDPATIAETQPDIGILAWWPYLLDRRLLGAATLGFLNFHPSLLPHQRGKHYYFWAIVERSPFGVTIHWATPEVDAGPIAFQRRIQVTWEDTGATLFIKAREEMLELFRDSLPTIVAGEIPRMSQPPGEWRAHRADELDPASRIDLDRSYQARELLDLIRARTFPPDGGARFTDHDGEYRVMVDIERLA